MAAFETTSCLYFVTGYFNLWEVEVFIHGRLAVLLFDLRLEDVEFVLHIPIDICEALLCCIVECVLSLLISKGWYHAIIELFDFSGWVFGTLILRRTFRAHFSDSQVLLYLMLFRLLGASRNRHLILRLLFRAVG